MDRYPLTLAPKSSIYILRPLVAPNRFRVRPSGQCKPRRRSACAATWDLLNGVTGQGRVSVGCANWHSTAKLAISPRTHFVKMSSCECQAGGRLITVPAQVYCAQYYVQINLLVLPPSSSLSCRQASRKGPDSSPRFSSSAVC